MTFYSFFDWYRYPIDLSSYHVLAGFPSRRMRLPYMRNRYMSQEYEIEVLFIQRRVYVEEQNDLDHVRQYVSDIVGFLEPEETEDEEYKITTVKVVEVDGAKIEDGPVVYDARNSGSLTDACDVAADIVLALGGLGRMRLARTISP